MLINCDKFFALALQEAGYDLDYKKLVEIYRRSRQHPEVQRRRRENQRLEEALSRADEESTLPSVKLPPPPPLTPEQRREIRSRAAKEAAATRARNAAKKAKARERYQAKKAQKAKQDKV